MKPCSHPTLNETRKIKIKKKKIKSHMKSLKHYVWSYWVHIDISSHLPDPYIHVLAPVHHGSEKYSKRENDCK